MNFSKSEKAPIRREVLGIPGGQSKSMKLPPISIQRENNERFPSVENKLAQYILTFSHWRWSIILLSYCCGYKYLWLKHFWFPNIWWTKSEVGSTFLLLSFFFPCCHFFFPLVQQLSFSASFDFSAVVRTFSYLGVANTASFSASVFSFSLSFSPSLYPPPPKEVICG